jgi:methylenetetrahydrofolate reductase (NADPH)
MRSESRLEKILGKGLFAVTAELNPPRGNDVDLLRRKAGSLKGLLDGVNITDNPSAIVHMSSPAAGALVVQMGLEPIMHIVARDRNRIAIQSDIFGATALGIKNILCLTGDHQSFGNQRDAKNVHDLDSIQLIDCVRNLRDQGTLLEENQRIDGQIRVFIGGVSNPFADPIDLHVIRLAKKIAAGADFIQTQCIYDMDRFKEWLRLVRDRGLAEKVPILAGVSPLKSGDRSKYLRKNLSAIPIPESLMERITRAPNPEEEGIKICVEQIEELKTMEGIHGIHVMGIEYEPNIGQILKRAGLLPRPEADA